MTKKLFLTLATFTLILTACASTSGTPASAPNSGPGAVELPAQARLVLGVIKLDETDSAVTAEQAAELLPMFYVLQDLNESDTAAQEEIDGLINQIQETLTADQTQAVADMSLSMRDVFSIASGNSGSTNSSNASSTTGGGGGGGFDGPPDMGGGMPGGNAGTGSTSNSNAMPAMNTSTPSAVFDAVIELLQKKIAK